MLRFEEPSDGCLLPALLSLNFGVIALLVAIGFSETPHEWWARICAPVYAVFTYWLYLFCNRRTVVVDASGVRVTFRPVPNVSGQFIPRSEIAFCYAADTVRDYDEGTTPDGTFFAFGVETRDGQRIHFYSTDSDREYALGAARTLCAEWNANPAEPPIEARLVAADYSNPTRKREVVFWAVLVLAAVVVGVAWEVR